MKRPQPDQGILPIAYRNPRSPAMPVEVLRLAALRARAPAGFFRRAQRTDFLVLLLADARVAHEVDFHRMNVGRGEAVVVAPGQVQRFSERGGDGWLLLVEGSLLERGAVAPRRAPVVLGPQEASVRSLLSAVERAERETPSPRTRRRLHHLVHALLLSLPEEAGAAAEDTTSGRVFRMFSAEVERRYAITRRIGDYASATGYSETTLNRAAHAMAGVSAKALVDARVLLEARRLLAHGDLTVGQIAARLGFSEITNFGKFLRRTGGESAQAFRRRYGQGTFR
jgi:AraC-like DNA-binding protein